MTVLIEANSLDQESLLSRALLHTEAKNFSAAIVDYIKFINLDPQNAQYCLQRSQLFYQTQEFNKTIYDADFALKQRNPFLCTPIERASSSKVKKGLYIIMITSKRFLSTGVLLGLLFFSKASQAQFVDTEWRVVAYAGATNTADSKNLLGKKQMFFKGFSEGFFYNCDYQGQSETYSKYTMQDFLQKEEFALFAKHKKILKINGKNVFVHRITCDGNNSEIYPFVTIEPGNYAYYIFEGVLYKLAAQ